jgi:hypothetical protein
MLGPIYAQNMNVNGDDQYTTPNVSTAVVDIGNQTLPSGNQVDLQLGFFSLGAEDQQQQFTTGSSDVDDYAINAWIMPGYFYNKSITDSYSFSLHIGSTAFDYPGSMYFGGYDKGRAIGPGTSWGDDNPPLQDIVLGVETGGSPWNFDSREGLLLSNTSAKGPLPVYPEPMVPALYLPKQTCDAIAKQLPVRFDSSGYYLWDTSDDRYTAITTSAAYLGFVFPPGPGGTEDVTIKVPFQLLVLNLTSEASGQSGLTPYFPCTPYDSTDGNYILGRAFLQAAFFGRNWNNKVWWLAQAPGPGSSNAGLGLEPHDIADSATSLDFYPDDGRFASSWSQHWTPLEDDGTAGDGGSSDSDSDDATTSSLSTGAKAGIGVGAAAVGVGLLAVIGWFFLRRNRKQRIDSDSGSNHEPEQPNMSAAAHYGSPGQAHASPGYQYSQISAHSPYEQGNPQYHPQQQYPAFVNEAYAPRKPDLPPAERGHELAELSGTIRHPASELPGHDPQELEAPYKRDANARPS